MQYRMTKQKQLILNVAKAHCDHPTADQLYLEIRAIDSRISRGTVYRNLEQLSETGELLQVKVPGANRFDSRTDFHYHAICSTCGAVCDIPIEYISDIDKKAQELSGFVIQRHRTVFEGMCPKCNKKA